MKMREEVYLMINETPKAVLLHRYVQKVDIFAIKYHYFCKLRPILNERAVNRGFLSV